MHIPRKSTEPLKMTLWKYIIRYTVKPKKQNRKHSMSYILFLRKTIIVITNV